MEPISFVDQLVKGVILAAYDFARLTAAGFIIPIISESRRFWISVISIEKRLSSLTYLVLWVLLTASIGLRSSAEVASSVTGLAKTPGLDIPTTIAIALLVSMLVDVTVRLSFSALHSRVRRRLYGDLARVAAANIFFGASIIMIVMSRIDTSDWIAQAAPIFFLGTKIWWLPNPMIFPFCISLGIIAVKAFAIKGRTRRGMLGLAVVFLAPVLLLNVSEPTYRLVRLSLATITPIAPIVEESAEIFPAFPRCEISSGKIHVSSDLMLKGADTFLLRSHNLAIYETDDAAGNGEAYVGRPYDDQSGAILLRDKYVHIELAADFSPVKPTVKRPVGRFFCRLKLIEGWTGGALGSLPIVRDPPSD